MRRRLVTERELVALAVDAHGAAAEKFVQEVFWRSYFKGWLELRPAVWDSYRTGLARDLEAVAADRRLARRVAEAEEGRTGLDCFDAWARELAATGYLHNHARMWVASIWIFTLRLPWRIGADWFLRHLLDGDPASNTLGWRWVAGLHTKGKSYRTDAWNIETFTRGRFAPEASALDPRAEPLSEPEPLPPACPPAPCPTPDPGLPTALLITAEDCTPEQLGLVRSDLAGVATLAATGGLSPREVAPAVIAFERGALADAAVRARAAGAPDAVALEADRETRQAAAHRPAEWLADWARACGARQVVTGFAPVGPARAVLEGAGPALARAGVRLVPVRRAWDEAVWPHATAGFFRVKQRIPEILAGLRA